MRVTKSDCDSSNDSRMNQVLLTNEHGDVFKRRINMDECDNEPYSETENVPASPIESEYFHEQFIDYPLNDSATDQTDNFRLPERDLPPFGRNMTSIRNDTVLNYDQHKLQQLHNKNNDGSSFTFFGMPLPSLSNLWGGGNSARKSTSRADIDANGKSRLRNFKPRPGEIVESFQFSNNVHLQPSLSQSQPQKPIPPTLKGDREPTNIQPPPPPNPNDYYAYSDPRIEKGGFVPMLPGRKGFTPIQNPYSNETEFADVQETVSTELRPNVSLEFDDRLEDVPDGKYSVLVPTVSADPIPNQPVRIIPKSFNVSSLKKGEINTSTKSANGFSLIRSSSPPSLLDPAISPIILSTTTQQTVAEMITKKNPPENDRNRLEIDLTKKNVQKISGKTQKLPVLSPNLGPDVFVTTTPFYSTFVPNSSDVINLSKNRVNGSSGIVAGSALSALVAPGATIAQQSIHRPSGRSSVTKVFNNTSPSSSFEPILIPLQSTTIKPTTTSSTKSTSTTIKTTTTTTTTTKPTTKTTTKQPIAQTLPTAEEYLRTTSQDNSIKEHTTPNSHSNKTPITNDLEDQATQYKGDMNWYYSNYNRSTWKEQQLDPGLYRLRTNSGNKFTVHFTSIISTLILATKHLV